MSAMGGQNRTRAPQNGPLLDAAKGERWSFGQPSSPQSDWERQRSKATRSTGRRGMWLIALIGNELLTILHQHHRRLGEARSRADR